MAHRSLDSGLLPCPFCGSSRLENLDDACGAVHCIDCGARGPLPGKLEAFLGVPEEYHCNTTAWDTRGGRFQ